jgi:DnaD/phage-associated family protein
MKKNEKITVAYSSPHPTQALITSVKAADEADLQLLLLLSLHKDSDELDMEEIRASLELTEEELAASVKYWRGAGILKKVKKTDAKATPAKDKKVEGKSAHANGKLERADAAPSYTSAELADLIEKRAGAEKFMNTAQQIMGKMFSTREMNILWGMVEYIGFDEECVLSILTYVASIDKKTVKYAEQLAFSLYDEGLTDKASIEERLAKMSAARSVRGRVEAMFGMTGRALTTREKKFLTAWTETMGFDADVIRLAYEITVDNTGEASLPYANKILESWHQSGLHTADEVSAEIEKSRAAKKNAKATSTKSFDTDEFFEAALKRTFEEI